jgi:RimJ/RimL family protein N-acetyltransferase
MSYRGTIDFDGSETLDDATNEVQGYFSGRSGGPPWPHCSWLCVEQESVIAACLVSFWNARNSPLVAYVMTRAGFKGHGIANALLQMTLRSLARQGQAEVRAVITSGNIPSERLFVRAGFRLVGGLS